MVAGALLVVSASQDRKSSTSSDVIGGEDLEFLEPAPAGFVLAEGGWAMGLQYSGNRGRRVALGESGPKKLQACNLSDAWSVAAS